jgi:hypothetical protein
MYLLIILQQWSDYFINLLSDRYQQWSDYFINLLSDRYQQWSDYFINLKLTDSMPHCLTMEIYTCIYSIQIFSKITKLAWIQTYKQYMKKTWEITLEHYIEN